MSRRRRPHPARRVVGAVAIAGYAGLLATVGWTQRTADADAVPPEPLPDDTVNFGVERLDLRAPATFQAPASVAGISTTTTPATIPPPPPPPSIAITTITAPPVTVPLPPKTTVTSLAPPTTSPPTTAPPTTVPPPPTTILRADPTIPTGGS